MQVCPGRSALRVREVDLERRSESGLAVHPDVALALLDDSICRREAQPCALPGFLRCIERLEQPALCFATHALPGIGHSEHHVTPFFHRLIVKHSVLELHVGGGDRQLTAVRHGISRVYHKVHYHLLYLSTVGQGHVEIGGKRKRDFDMLADQPSEHARHSAEHCVQIEGCSVEDLLTAEGEQLAGETSGTSRRLDDFIEVFSVLALNDFIGCYQLGESENHSQQIVEVMRNS